MVGRWARLATRRTASLGHASCFGASPAIPLDATHLRDPSRDQGEVYLRQVHGVRHVNALAPDQRLTLHRVGLTIIYGDNGSGKSGYARILKKACRARMPTAAVGQVLSEGEHRCVALAAFMAELATTENKSGIVFDDPVSSLDHMHREAVASALSSRPHADRSLSLRTTLPSCSS